MPYKIHSLFFRLHSYCCSNDSFFISILYKWFQMKLGSLVHNCPKFMNNKENTNLLFSISIVLTKLTYTLCVTWQSCDILLQTDDLNIEIELSRNGVVPDLEKILYCLLPVFLLNRHYNFLKKKRSTFYQQYICKIRVKMKNAMNLLL